MDEEGVLAAAAAIRPYLAELTGPGASELERRLTELLAGAGAGETVVVPILTLLSENPATREWMRHALAIPREERAFQPQAGTASVSGLRYACPKCGREWYRFSVLDVVPVCEADEIPYERVS